MDYNQFGRSRQASQYVEKLFWKAMDWLQIRSFESVIIYAGVN